MDNTRLSTLIGAVYDAALEQDRWADALGQIGASMGGAAGILAVHPWSGGVQWAAIAKLDPASMPTYASDFSSAAKNPYFEMVHRVPLGEPISGEALTAPAAVEDTDFYRTILAPQRLRHAMVTTLLRDDQRVAAAAFLRPADAGPFVEQEFALLRLLVPHLQRALKLTLRIEQLRAESASLAEALNVSATGTLLADAYGQVIFVNPAGRHILKEDDGLSLKAGVLTVQDPVARRELAAAIALTAGGTTSAEHETFEAASALSVPRTSGRRPYNLLAWPLRLQADGLLVDVPSALILVSDPASNALPPLEALAAIYGFTPSETALAALLVDGHTLQEAAGKLTVTMNTVKSHIKELFAKTNTRRQVELVRLLLQFPPLASR